MQLTKFFLYATIWLFVFCRTRSTRTSKQGQLMLFTPKIAKNHSPVSIVSFLNIILYINKSWSVHFPYSHPKVLSHPLPNRVKRNRAASAPISKFHRCYCIFWKAENGCTQVLCLSSEISFCHKTTSIRWAMRQILMNTSSQSCFVCSIIGVFVIIKFIKIWSRQSLWT